MCQRMGCSGHTSTSQKCWERFAASEDCRAVGYKYAVSVVSFVSVKEIKKIKRAGLKQSVQNPEFKSFTALHGSH